eukprot:3573661-Rhodomonas_salina.1
MSKIAFTVYAQAAKVQEVVSLIASDNLVNDLLQEFAEEGIIAELGQGSIERPSPQMQQIRDGKVWNLVGGVYVLDKCPQGFLKINLTLDTQECRQCEPDTYSVNPTLGCGLDTGMCEARACLACPVGVRCYRGSEP